MIAMPVISSRMFALWLLFGINFINFFDRQILAAVTEPIRLEWGLTDTQLGWLVTAFTLLYAAMGLPLGRLADLWQRKYVLAIGLTFWSGLTGLSGICRHFWPLFAARLGIGVGEASCAPAASSLIGDLFPQSWRSRAMSVFMLGLPAGVGASYLVGGAIAQHFGWRAVFYLACIPGLLLAAGTLFLAEPCRGLSEARNVGSAQRQENAGRLVLGIPTMRWIIVSGILHNFIMYGFTFFLVSFLVRHHGTTVQMAGLASALVVAGAGTLGMLSGGWLGDAAHKRRQNGRMLVAGTAVLAAVPVWFLALLLPRGSLLPFILIQGAAVLPMYVYYPAVYATIHDLIEPAIRGRAMAIYFFAMYMLGASAGPVTTGWLSDYMARRAALVAGVVSLSVPESFRAAGLYHAMFALPALALLLAAVLFAGAATTARDSDALREWMLQFKNGEAKETGIRITTSD